MPALSRLVFVHGSRHGSWCWSEVGTMLGTTALTRDGWGSVRRTYLICTRDAAIRPALQAKFVAEADAALPDNPTSVVALDASQSPFLSMPERVADVVIPLG